jgi:hypothetical protein
MKIALLHLSDIHLKTDKDWILKRVPLIEHATRPIVENVEACFIVITGDLAFSGRAEEYEIAKRALRTLFELLHSEYPTLKVEFVIVPGNHDCNFTKEDTVRVALLASGSKILDQMKLEDDSIPRALLQTQDSFFEFLAEIEASGVRTGYERLAYSREFSLNGKRIRFDCYNTAWMSRQKEKPAELLFPIDLLEDPAESGDVVVALFHHPTQWLEPNNARLFRARVEYRSNLILTGHEHVSDQYTKQHELTKEVSLYLEAAVLQNSNPQQSGFQTVELDLEENKKRLTQYEWRRNIYVRSNQSEWTPLEPPAKQQETNLVNTESYLRSLTDPGANFSHKSRRALELNDIYVYPELTLMPLEKSAEKAIPIIDSDKTMQFVIDHPKLLIAGAEVSGKTALARTLYGELSRRGLAPLMLHGEHVKTTSPREVTKLIDRHIAEQYGEDATDRYVQVRKDLRIVILDDFHKIRLNREGREVFLKALEAVFGRVLLLVDAFFEFQEMAQPPSESDLMRYSHAQISEFGHRLRYQLVSKWIKLGQEYTSDETELRRTINDTAEIITTLLGRKMVPRYPIFILSMLQALDTNSNLNATSGAFGYFYEVFILQSLSLNRTPAITMDMITTFLTLVGHRMFELRRMHLTTREWDDITSQYFRDYGVPFDRVTMVKILESAKIIHRQTETFEFKYKYVYYYFVAKHLAVALGTSSKRKKARQLIITMTENLNIEAYGHVIMFLVYLTKDEKTISEVLKRARSQYVEFQAADLEADIEFLNTLQLDIPKLSLTDGDVEENKDVRLRQMDDVERTFETNDDADNDDYLERKIDDAIRLEVAGKTMQIAGQILRNFPGALPRKQKLDLTREIHLLGLRVLSMILKSLDLNKDRFRLSFKNAMQEIRKGADENDISRQAEQLLFIVGGGVTFGLIKMISSSIGSEHLKEIYAEALKNNPDVPTSLVSLAINLDYFRPFPEKEVDVLSARLAKNHVALTVFRLLVRDHFHIEKEDYRLRQRVCSRIGIDFKDYRMIEDKYKR